MRHLAALALSCSLAAASPCQLVVFRSPQPGLAPLYSYVFALYGSCRDVRVQVSLLSEIGGEYPTPPAEVTPERPVRLLGNLPWWRPVKITPDGPLLVPFRESP